MDTDSGGSVIIGSMSRQCISTRRDVLTGHEPVGCKKYKWER
jgi:hypothetical protein